MKAVLDNYGQATDKAEPGKPVSAAADLMDQKQKLIDKSNLDLLMNELSFDLESFKVYRQKVVLCMSNRARKIQDWKGQVVQDAQQAADHYMSLYVACRKSGFGYYVSSDCVRVHYDFSGIHCPYSIIILGLFHHCYSKVTLKTWATQDPGAAAITDVKKEVAQGARALQIPEDGSVT